MTKQARAAFAQPVTPPVAVRQYGLNTLEFRTPNQDAISVRAIVSCGRSRLNWLPVPHDARASLTGFSASTNARSMAAMLVNVMPIGFGFLSDAFHRLNVVG